jgi:hypothetical protein
MMSEEALAKLMSESAFGVKQPGNEGLEHENMTEKEIKKWMDSIKEFPP